MAKRKIPSIDIYQMISGDYFNMTPEEKQDICNQLFELLIKNIQTISQPELNTFDILRSVLQNTLTEYEKYEMYEACSILKDMIKTMDEA